MTETLPRPTFDFDHHGPEYRDGWGEIARDYHASGGPVVWSGNHDGFWLVGSFAACAAVLEDWETFTSYNDLEGTGNGGRGMMIPQMPYRLELGESDAPLHTQRRRIEVPFFTPRALREWGPVAQRNVDDALDAVIQNGTADLVNDIVLLTAARTTLHLLGYSVPNMDHVADVAHRQSFTMPTSPDFARLYAEATALRGDFRKEFLSRRADPTGDLISALAAGTVDGKPLSDQEGESMINALVLGGFDTTTSATTHALRWLSTHREEIPKVRDDAKYRKNAVEELLRYFPPTSSVARTAVRDTEVMGQKIAKGERILCWLAGANRDPQQFPDPDTIDLARANAPEHLSFSNGNHRCLGSPLAKVEIGIMLETILRRIPDFTFDEDKAQPYPSIGFVNGYISAPISFTPRAPLGAFQSPSE
ncbi:cytochrome P450 [Arthrobacter sp. W4I7]|uniref:cytochrome P450 n=1 Tax=Arthrobacter sp. W4I7 TaxID=3042296 RepID=UPI00278A4410|nr:cytochrome P450 [Arthrobacter sp. W4I7]MDQ0691437.1 cytochrome P450 [Arthrobacter sp. W4I7]